MIQRGHSPGFLLKTAQAVLIVCQGTREDFDGNVTLEAGVAPAVDLAHAARAEQGEDFVWPQFRSNG
jgi:hypothetical protein